MTQIAVPTLPLSIDFSVIQDWDEVRAAYNNEVVLKEGGDSVIVAFNLAGDPEIAQLAKPFGANAEQDFHVTLLYLGDGSLDKEAIKASLATFATLFAPIDGMFNGVARFVQDTSDEEPVVLTLDSVGLSGFRQVLRELFPWAEQNHGFVPHCTLAYVTRAIANSNPVSLPEPIYLQFDTIWLYWGDERIGFPLTGDMVLKHLPGQHDQQTHAPKSGVRFVSSGDMAKEIRSVAKQQLAKGDLVKVVSGAGTYYGNWLTLHFRDGYDMDAATQFVNDAIAGTTYGIEFTNPNDVISDGLQVSTIRISNRYLKLKDVAEKHLPGQHDQQSHTPKRYGDGGGADYTDVLGRAIFGDKELTNDDMNYIASFDKLSDEYKNDFIHTVNNVRKEYDLFLDHAWVSDTMADNVAADTMPDIGNLRINANFKIEAIIDANERGFLATNDFVGVLTHELAHLIRWDREAVNEAYAYHARFAGSVSRYAMASQNEWISEIFALSNSTTQDQHRIDYAKHVLSTFGGNK